MANLKDMKAILEFNLDDPDDRMAHMRCVKSTDMAIVLFDIVYNMDRHVEDIEGVKKYISELLDYQGINIDELIN